MGNRFEGKVAVVSGGGRGIGRGEEGDCCGSYDEALHVASAGGGFRGLREESGGERAYVRG